MSDVTEINVETGEVIVRAYTDEEIQHRNSLQKPADPFIDQEALSNYLSNKQSALLKLQALGLTEEEAKALAGI